MKEGDEKYQALESRVGWLHLKQRLGIERDKEAKIFGQGINFFHLENWYSIHSVMRFILKLTGVYWWGRRNSLKIQVKENQFILPALPKSFHGYRILHLSDLHVDINEQMASAIAKSIEGLEYDLCVLTGDYRAKSFGDIQPANEGMALLAAAINKPAYAVLGNHDSICMVYDLEKSGYHLLMNESVVLEKEGHCLYLAGVDDPHYYRAENFEKTTEAIPRDAVSILLCHSPEMYKHASYANFDVMLCGHSHGGQICLPGGIPIMRNARAPHYLTAGEWRYHAMQGYTSVGAGSSIVDVRFNCPAEVTIHQLLSTEQSECQACLIRPVSNVQPIE